MGEDGVHRTTSFFLPIASHSHMESYGTSDPAEMEEDGRRFWIFGRVCYSK